jgi:hypothetical protein
MNFRDSQQFGDVADVVFTSTSSCVIWNHPGEDTNRFILGVLHFTKAGCFSTLLLIER